MAYEPYGTGTPGPFSDKPYGDAPFGSAGTRDFDGDLNARRDLGNFGNGAGRHDFHDTRGDGLHDEPLAQLLGEFTTEAKRFLRAETTRAKTELRHEAKKVAASGGMFAGAALIGHTALLCLTAALVVGLGHLIGFGWSALIVGMALAIGAAVLALSAKKAIANVTAPNVRAQLREDAAWLRDTTQTVKASRHVDA